VNSKRKGPSVVGDRDRRKNDLIRKGKQSRICEKKKHNKQREKRERKEKKSKGRSTSGVWVSFTKPTKINHTEKKNFTSKPDKWVPWGGPSKGVPGKTSWNLGGACLTVGPGR